MNAPDKTVEVSQAARELLKQQAHELVREACRYCGVEQPSGYQLMGPFTEDCGPWQVAMQATIAALQSTTRATQPEAALREALGREEIANIIRDAVTEEESDIDGGYVGNLLEHGCDRAGYDDPHRTSEACIDLAVEGLRAALKDHRHG